MSSFVQRTYDQLSQDLALNSNPATILVFWGSISGMDATHLTVFDIPLISNIPNIVYLAPTCKEEYLKMLDWSVEQQNKPVVIRVPFGEVHTTGIEDKTDYSILNKYQVVEKGSEVAILGLGNFFHLGKKVQALLNEKLGIKATLINPKFITGVDEELMESLKAEHKVVITLEDGVLDGGFGEKIARYFGNSEMKVFGQHCPKWVSIVENNTLTDIESVAIIKNDLDKMLKNNPEKIVLGCTHYPFLLKILSKFAPSDMFIDPAIPFAEFIKNDLAKSNLLNTSTAKKTEEFYVSSDPVKFKKSAKMFYDLKENPELLTF